MFLGMVVVVILTSTFATVAVIVIVIFIVLHLRKTPKATENPEATMEGATIEAKRIVRYDGAVGSPARPFRTKPWICLVKFHG